MWPDAEAPPRPADDLLESVLRRGHELRHAARVRRQAGWVARAAAVVAVAGVAAGLAHGTDDRAAREGQLAGPPQEVTVPDGPDPTAPVGRGAPAPAPTTGGAAHTTTSSPDPTPRRSAPLAVLEQRGADGQYRTVVLHPDGTLVPITAASAERQMPVLAPQGDVVAFQRQSPHPLTAEPRWEVFTIRADGTDLRQITGGIIEGGPRLIDSPLGAGSRWPTWSPDGRQLAFSCSGPTGLPVICTARADGSGRRPLTAEGQGFYQPTWSPDGRTLAAKREVGAGRVELWLLDVAGGSPSALPVPSVDPRGVRLSWTVDGTKLVYAQVEEAPFGLVIVDVGTGARRFVTTPSPARFPIVCGPDQILYLESDAGLDEDRLRPGRLVLVGADGSAPSTVVPAQPDVELLPSSCAAR